MDTMFVTKIVGCFCAAMLVLLCGNWAASAIYAVGDGAHGGGHGDGDDHSQGYYIEVATADEPEEEEEVIDVAALMAAADVGKGEGVFKKCAACHTIDEGGSNKTGPALHGILDNDIGAVAGFSYTGILSELPGNWTTEELFAFLENPKGYAPGTKMSFSGLKKPTDRANLIAYLATTE